MSTIRLRHQGEEKVIEVCEECLSGVIAQDNARRRREDFPLDHDPAPAAETSPAVAAIAELLGEAESLGLLQRLRRSAHKKGAFFD